MVCPDIEDPKMKSRTNNNIGWLFASALMAASTAASAQEQSKMPNQSNFSCDQPGIKKIFIDALNGSQELRDGGIRIIDFKSDRMVMADADKNTVACHGAMIVDGGKKFTGVVRIAAPGDKTDIDWYDDNTEDGLMASNKSSQSAKQTTSSNESGSFSARDIAKIISTYDDNEMRFKRDYAGQTFSDSLPFESASEPPFVKDQYIVSFGRKGGLGKVYCIIKNPSDIAEVANWHKGDMIRIQAKIYNVVMNSIALNKCDLAK
jgi:putative nucleic acid binding protein